MNLPVKKVAALVLFLPCCALLAQITLSTIRGSATDPTGAVMVNASISLTNVDTGAKRDVVTDPSGNFEIPDLPRGKYRLVANAPGFKTFVADDILLEGSQIRRINLSFELGTVGTEVSVTAGAAIITTDSAKIQGFVNVNKHFDNPWVAAEANLDHSLYITTLPLVQQAGGVWSTRVSGQPSNQVQMGQDGHTNDSAVNQLNDILDTQEVQVTPVSNSAEFARVGYLNLVTKSGSNQFHGRFAYWHQNSALGAREFFEGSDKYNTLIHTTSISMSGPIIKDKTFFYASWNNLKEPGEQFYLRDVPTTTDAKRRFLAIAEHQQAHHHPGPDDRQSVPRKHHSIHPAQPALVAGQRKIPSATQPGNPRGPVQQLCVRLPVSLLTTPSGETSPSGSTITSRTRTA